MKLEEMSNMDLAYIEGFIKACADKGVDPELFLESLTKPAADGELSKPMPGGSKKEKKEEAPDYEKRRRGMAIGLGSLGGALTGAQAGAMSASPFRGSGERGARAIIGGVAGAGLGAGAAAIYNAIRKYMGFSAFGTPVTLGKDVQ